MPLVEHAPVDQLVGLAPFSARRAALLAVPVGEQGTFLAPGDPQAQRLVASRGGRQVSARSTRAASRSSC
jgi:hypothetical protein